MERCCYHYDGTFAGFLTCVRDIYRHGEPPALFLSPGDDRPSLYPDRWVETDEPLVRRVYARLRERLEPQGLRLVTLGFLTCLEEREQRLAEVIDLGLRVGPGVEKHLENDHVLQVCKAVRHLQRECQLLTGFTRFADHNGLLLGEIAPKNQALPVLRPHFCDRMAGEAFCLFDATHRQLLLHRPGSGHGGRGDWAILPAEDFRIPSPGEEERAYQSLWRRFYDAVSIQGRYNPKCRQTHMPKRYWAYLTELQDEAPPGPQASLSLEAPASRDGGAEGPFSSAVPPASPPTPAGGDAAWLQRRTP